MWCKHVNHLLHNLVLFSIYVQRNEWRNITELRLLGYRTMLWSGKGEVVLGRRGCGRRRVSWKTWHHKFHNFGACGRFSNTIKGGRNGSHPIWRDDVKQMTTVYKSRMYGLWGMLWISSSLTSVVLIMKTTYGVNLYTKILQIYVLII